MGAVTFAVIPPEELGAGKALAVITAYGAVLDDLGLDHYRPALRFFVQHDPADGRWRKTFSFSTENPDGLCGIFLRDPLESGRLQPAVLIRADRELETMIEAVGHEAFHVYAAASRKAAGLEEFEGPETYWGGQEERAAWSHGQLVRKAWQQERGYGSSADLRARLKHSFRPPLPNPDWERKAVAR